MTKPDTLEDGEALLHGGCLNTVLRLAARQITQIYDAALAPSGLTAAQARLVAVVAELDDSAGEGPVLQDVARRLGLEVSALTHALRPLLRDGVLTVSRGTADGRTRHARLTPAGAARLDRVMALYAEVNGRIADRLGAEETATLRRLSGMILRPGFAP